MLALHAEQDAQGETISMYEPDMKTCGHNCCPSTVPMCCACSDLRPVLAGDVYPCYVDGEGWQDSDARNAGYCPVCNPKNYAAWERKIEIERVRKEELKAVVLAQEQDAWLVREEDRARAAAELQQEGDTTTQQFTYSSGDMYSGDMRDGLPHGTGVMSYEGGEEYSGQWRRGQHHGSGDKNWGDGITYCGEWQNGMMHGAGHYVMADGTEVTGSFAEDEFVE